MAPAFVPTNGMALASRSRFCGMAVDSCATRPAYTCAGTNRVRMVNETPADPIVEPVAETEPVVENEMGEEEVGEVAVCDPPQFFQNAQAIAEARSKFKLHETDSGSPEYQIATLSTRITYLTNHLKEHPKDHSSTRGLLKMVSTRRRLLKYVKRQDPSRFDSIISGLGIRVSQQLRNL